jgi:protein O-GlcNAc transferase
MVSSAFQQQLLARAFAAHQAGNLGQAERLYQQVLTNDKQHFDALHMLGIIEGQRGNFSGGLRRLKEALRVKPSSADALINLGRMQSELGDDSGAVTTYEKALAIAPLSVLAHMNFATVLSRLRQSEKALLHCNQAVDIAPDLAEAWCCRANVLLDLQRPSEALKSYDRALSLQPKLPDGYLGRGQSLRQLNRHEEALADYERALALNSALSEAWYGCGRIFFDLRRYEEAIAAYTKAMALNPDYAQGAYLATKMQICDWNNFDIERAQLVNAVTTKGLKTDPFRMLGVSSSPSTQKRCAEIFVADKCPATAKPLWHGEKYRHDKIRIAYVSSDLRHHPMAHLTVGMFEAHERTGFETTAVSLLNANDDMQQRLRGAFDHFLEGQFRSDRDVAEALRFREIDIAVDLNGYTTHSRSALFALRPAPIQVNYLGYPGTTAAPYIDYILADRTVIPEEDTGFYTEKIVWLPDTYYPNDDGRRIAERTPLRGDLGLPETAFIFCCFNNTYKIQPMMFDVWMRLLRRVEGSVLWLLKDNDISERNLRAEAARRGVGPERLVFAPRVAFAEHLARHRQADLFLDTLPYNAHTTACDALWVGVPVVTCLGATFVGRVAASLLKAIGLPELTTTSIEDYEALALKIALEPSLHNSLKQKLAFNRDVSPLFDTVRFSRHIEAAFRCMWEQLQRGQQPQSFAVEPLNWR